MRKIRRTFLIALMASVAVFGGWLILDHVARAEVTPIKWRDALKQPREWYGSTEAVRIADNLIAYQRESGGWPKNIDMAVVLNENQRSNIEKEKGSNDSTIDNGATYSQMIFLARVYT